ncbi:MAG: hypothetical protein ACTSUR_02415 [Candidatus Heimdallarchaeaceae archaeon]
MILDAWLTLVGLLISLVAIGYGIWIMSRVAGKLKISVIFLILAVAVFLAEQIFYILNILKTIRLEISTVAHIAIAFFVLLAIMNMKGMINKIDHDLKKSQE